MINEKQKYHKTPEKLNLIPLYTESLFFKESVSPVSATYPPLLNPHPSGSKGKHDPGRISQEITYSARPVGNKGLMDLIRETVEYSNYNKDEIGSQGIIKVHVPWIGSNHQCYAEEKIGSTVEQKVIEGDHIKRKLDFFQGRNIKKDPCRDKGRKSVCNFLRKHHHLSALSVN